MLHMYGCLKYAVVPQKSSRLLIFCLIAAWLKSLPNSKVIHSQLFFLLQSKELVPQEEFTMMLRLIFIPFCFPKYINWRECSASKAHHFDDRLIELLLWTSSSDTAGGATGQRPSPGVFLQPVWSAEAGV